MVVPFNFVTKSGNLVPKWKKEEQYFIWTNTSIGGSGPLDLFFLSGYLAFDHVSSGNHWAHESLEFSFDDLQWMLESNVRVAPSVSLATISNMSSEDTEMAGWAVDYTTFEIVHDQNKPYTTIKIKSDIAVSGHDTHLNRAAYYVVATGRIYT